MLLDPEISKLSSVSEPQLDEDVFAIVKRERERIDQRMNVLRRKYAYGLSSPFRLTRKQYAEEAAREIADPMEQQALVNMVSDISRAQEWMRRKKYAEAGYLGRFMQNLQVSGMVYEEAGAGIVEAAGGLVETIRGRAPTQGEVQFSYALEAAKQHQNPTVPKYADLAMKISTGAIGTAPGWSAGLLSAAVTGTPAGMFGYYALQQYPERQRAYIGMGVDPTTATALGLGTAAAEAGIELFQRDPTGLTRGAAAPGRRALMRRIVGEVPSFLKRVGEEAILEEGAQAAVETGAQYVVGKLYPGAEGPSFRDVLAAPPAAVKQALPGMAGLSFIGGGARVLGRPSIPRKAAKESKRDNEILEFAHQRKTPSRKQWREWGFTEKETSRRQRREDLRIQAEDIRNQDQVMAVLYDTPPTSKQWKLWEFPEDVKIPQERLEFLRSWIIAGAKLEVEAGVGVEPQEIAQEAQEGAIVTEAAVEPGAEAIAPGAPDEAVGGVPERVHYARAIQEGVPALRDRESSYAAQPATMGVTEAPEVETVVEAEIPRPRRGLARVGARGALVARDMIAIASPASISNEARRAKHILREEMARGAMRTKAAQAKLRASESLFFRMAPEERIEFIMNMEEGKEQATPELNTVAKAIRKELDIGRDRLRAIGKLEEFYENYFPHIWKHRPDIDVVLGRIIRKPWMPSGFLRKRTIPTIREGLALTDEAGNSLLELISDNPIELAMHRLAQINEYLAKYDSRQQMKQTGMAKFVPAAFGKNYLSAGYEFIEDPAFTVQTDANTTIEEAYDKLLHDQLMSIAAAMGIEHERILSLRDWGISRVGEREIKTRIGGTMSTLGHEIGHQIGDVFGLYDWMLENIPGAGLEMKALAHLRIEGMEEVPLGMFEYIESRAEKEAAILEAWIAAPEKMQEVAPNVTRGWVEFLEKHEQLQPLLMLNRSLVLGKAEVEIEQPGIRVLGRWALPSEVAVMIRNHLSPGLRRNRNQFVKGGYELARTLGNAMNQASLSLSGFHALNVMTDAVASQYALGFRQIARGKLGKGAKNIAIAMTQIAPTALAVRYGDKIYKALQSGDIESIEDPMMRRAAELVIMAGGRATLDPRYHNEAIRTLRKSFYDLKHGNEWKRIAKAAKLPVEIVFAFLEASSWPVMNYLVPRMKLGVFYQMAMDICERQAEEGLDDFQFREQLSNAWDSVDNRLGQLCYDNLFWNQYVKDFLQLSFRSVGWNLGSIREYLGAVVDVVGFRQRMARGDQFLSQKMAYTLGAFATYFPIGALMTYLLTSEPPEELKDYLFPRTGRMNRDGTPERLSLPTYAKDWVAWGTRPGKAFVHKMHPLWGTLHEMIWNEDYYGVEIRSADDPWMAQLGDTLARLGEAFVPFSARNFRRMREAEEPIALALPMAAAGISSAPAYLTRTPAHKKAIDILSGRYAGKRTKEQAAASRAKRILINKFRKREEVSKADLELLSQTQIKNAIREAQLTPFQALFSKLSSKEALDVYELCNEEEQRQVRGILAQKLSKARK